MLIAVGGWQLIFAVNVPLVAHPRGVRGGLVVPRRSAPARRSCPEPARSEQFAATLTALLLFSVRLRAHHGRCCRRPDPAEARAGFPFLEVRMLADNRALTATSLRFGVTMLVAYCFIYGWTP